MTSIELPGLVVADRQAWGRWLSEHHAEPGVWLILAKKGVTDPTRLTYSDALDEALCHGWIDGQRKPGDATTYRQRFTPRRTRSSWSQRNVGRVERLLTEGHMHEAGIAEMESAKADGRWAAAYPGQAAAQIPEDLAAELARSPSARALFDVLTAQNRYALTHRITTTRNANTRATRVQQFVAMLARGDTIYPQKRGP